MCIYLENVCEMRFNFQRLNSCVAFYFLFANSKFVRVKCAFAFVRDICVRVRKYNAAESHFLSFCFLSLFSFSLLASFVRWNVGWQRNLFSLVVEKQKKNKKM